MTPKQIAEWLREQNPTGEGPRIELLVPGTRLTIRCDNTREAIDAVADKYARGFPRRGRQYYGTDQTKHPTNVPRPGSGPAGTIR